MNGGKDNRLAVPEDLQSKEGVFSPATSLPLIALVITSLLSIVVSIMALRSGTYIIFQNLFYLPIIIACYYYKKTGFIVAIALALIYFILTAAYTSDSSIILNAIIRAIIFITIGAIVAGMSAARTRTAEKLMLKAFNEGIVQNISDGIVILNDSGEVLFANPALQTLLGYTADELGGMSWKSLVPPESWDIVEMALARRKEGIVDHYELVLNRKDGTQVPVHISGSPYRDSKTGEITGALTTVTDLTELKKAEAAVIRSEKEKRLILDNANEIIAYHDLERRLIWANQTYLEGIRAIAGSAVTLDDMVGRKCHEAWGLSQACSACPVSLAIKTGEPQAGELTPQNQEHWPSTQGSWIIRAAPVKDADGAIVGAIEIAHDITARKKTEEVLKLQARERAAVDTFTYSVSNDLQAPLRRIEGFSEMLLEECPEQLNERARDYLKRIITQIGSMKALTDALLQLSRVVSHSMEREAVNLSALVRSNLEKLQYEDPERRVETAVAPELIVEGDADLLNTMLAGLVDNAWKFTSGAKEARVEFGSTEQEGRTVYYLKDNGAGFDMNHADQLFTPFQKLHSEGKYPGIGIGLNLVYRIINRHGGEIWAEGEPGKGACFFFTLP